MRIKRGTLTADKQGGRLYVYPTGDPTPDRTDALIAELQFIDHANACRGRSYGGGLGRAFLALQDRSHVDFRETS